MARDKANADGAQDDETLTVAGEELRAGDWVRFPVSRKRTLGPLRVKEVDGTRVYLSHDATLYTEDAIAFAVLESPDGVEEILGVEHVEEGGGPAMEESIEEILGESDDDSDDGPGICLRCGRGFGTQSEKDAHDCADGGRAGPLPDPSDEREAIRDAIRETDLYVLTYHGGEPAVALVNRDKAPSTEHATGGETVVLVEWHGGDDYALSTAAGKDTGSGWELDKELAQRHPTRAAAVDGARELFDDE